MAVARATPGLLPLAGRGVQRAKTIVTVGLQRAHTHLLSQGEGLAVMGGGLVDVRGIAMHGTESRFEDPQPI